MKGSKNCPPMPKGSQKSDAPPMPPAGKKGKKGGKKPMPPKMPFDGGY